MRSLRGNFLHRRVSTTDTVDYFRFQVYCAKYRISRAAVRHSAATDMPTRPLLGQECQRPRLMIARTDRHQWLGIRHRPTRNLTVLALKPARLLHRRAPRRGDWHRSYDLRLQVDSIGETSPPRESGRRQYRPVVPRAGRLRSRPTATRIRDVYKVNLAHSDKGGGNEILYFQITPADRSTWVGDASDSCGYMTDDNGNGLLDDFSFIRSEHDDLQVPLRSLASAMSDDAYLVVEARTPLLTRITSLTSRSTAWAPIQTPRWNWARSTGALSSAIRSGALPPSGRSRTSIDLRCPPPDRPP